MVKLDGGNIKELWACSRKNFIAASALGGERDKCIKQINEIRASIFIPIESNLKNVYTYSFL